MIERGKSSQVVGGRATVGWEETLNATNLLLVPCCPHPAQHPLENDWAQ